MHVRRTTRDALFPSKDDDQFFSWRRGDLTFRDHVALRLFCDRVNEGEGRTGASRLSTAEVGAMVLVHDALHALVTQYRRQRGESFARLDRALDGALGPEKHAALVEFLAKLPPPAVYRALRGEGDDTPEVYLERARRSPGDSPFDVELGDELLLLWATNQNPAYEPVRSLVGDAELGPAYHAFVAETRRFFEAEGPFGPRGETLVDLLLAPGRVGRSIFEQLGHVRRTWGDLGVGDFALWTRFAGVDDLRAEEGRWFFRGGPGLGEARTEVLRFEPRRDEEPALFSHDRSWMPNVVLIAKSVYVWLDQLSQKYGRPIRTLDRIPDEELDLLSARHITGLWLIGLFERSPASRKVKRMRGDADALASAYALKSYELASDLGGVPAYENLKARAAARGLRLAADMVPNHVGIDGDWVMRHPEWFLQAPRPPFPAYRFGGPDLSDDPSVGIFLEEGYWNGTDAAVVFRRHDRQTGEDRFIYHGNDGTSMPWNDTAQLDYSNPATRHAVIETVLHVARMFPIIRFDAAMTLAKRHIQRLWFPLPGQGGAIPSRADYALTQEAFERAIPIEFWREVVDAVAERAPDTLLLAEAFWMMEGYFVRTLGMHRVYNSAFMNMQKREENAKYRETLKNVLDFDPQVLKRFVNFMNNPDEETAIAQFGDGDKYFGVCALMCTLPGLPMFGHGQIEGLHEKYGMEYHRPRREEAPSAHLIGRHEREIFPILEKRWLWSDVERFALYDFVAEGGEVDDDVYAYSNGAGEERALFLYNNRYKTTRGTIRASTHRGTLGEELGLVPGRRAWLVLRDVTHGLEYLHREEALLRRGLEWTLHAYERHVFTGFRPVQPSLERPYDRLADELAGRGVPDVERAVRELYLRPVHAPLRQACSKGHLEYLAAQLSAEDEFPGLAALRERLEHVADGLDWMLAQRSGPLGSLEREAALTLATRRFTALREAIGASESAPAEPQSRSQSEEVPAPAGDAAGGDETIGAPPAGLALQLAALQIEAVISLLSAEAAARTFAARPSAAVRREGVEGPLGDGASDSEAARDTAPSTRDANASSAALLPGAGASAIAVDSSAPAADAALPSPRVDVSIAVPSSAPGGEGDLPRSSVVVSSSELSRPPLAEGSLVSPRLDPSVAAPTGAGASPSEPAAPEALVAEWAIAAPLGEGLSTLLGPAEGSRVAELLIVAATLPTGAIAPALCAALESPLGRSFLKVHEYGGVVWLVQEPFEALATFLAERERAFGRLSAAQARGAPQVLAALAQRAGYRVEAVRAALVLL